jgi:hypothetical protein
MLQEAFQATMEIHDDDPDHFKFIFKYMYTHCYDIAAIVTLAAGDRVRRTTIPLEIYLVADKYNMPSSLFRETVSNSKNILYHDDYTLDELLSLVPLYYDMISEAAHPFGTLLVEQILGEFREETWPDEFTDVVKKNPVFGVDVALQLGAECVSCYYERCQCRARMFILEAIVDMRYDCPDCFSGETKDLCLSTSFEDH